MERATEFPDTSGSEPGRDPDPDSNSDRERERRLGLLLARLPARVQAGIAWLRRPQATWVRVPAAILLILGSVLFILPVFGLWMLPVGLVLLADDVAPLRRVTGRWLAWIERRHPGWMGLKPDAAPRPAAAPSRLGRTDR